MQNSKVVIVLKVSIVLLFLWTVTFLLYFAAPKQPKAHIEIPSEFEQLVIIQPTDVLLDAFKQLATDENYQYLYRKIAPDFKNKVDKSTKENSGINLLKPFILITDSTKQTLVFSLSNEKNFAKFAQKSNLSYKIKDKKAFVAISGKVLVPKKFKSVLVETKDFLSVMYPTNHKWTTEIRNNLISFAGNIPNNATFDNTYLSKIPQTKGVFLQFPFPSDLLTGKERFSQLPIEWKNFLENIKAIAIDYQGINASSKGIFPIFNCVFSFRYERDIFFLKEQVEKIKGADFKQITYNHYQISFAEKVYTLKQIVGNEWFFGLDETQLIENTAKNLISLQGKPMYLTEAKGGLFTAALNFIPGFTPTKNLLNKTENVDIRVFHNGTNFDIKGNLTFKPSENAALDFLAYGIEMAEIRDFVK